MPPKNESPQKKFENLMRELFQMDMADLDFGIYRIFNMKRKQINKFLESELPDKVEGAFEIETGKELEKLREDVSDMQKELRNNLAEDAVGSEGTLSPEYAKTKLGKEYEALRKQLASVETTEEQKTEIFVHLVNFFSRYYDDADFIPRRFIGSGNQYMVPYNGEEVMLHWANRDQYYIKTGETFRDYVFTLKDEGTISDFRVRLTMAAVNTVKDNVKGKKRFFFPQPENTRVKDNTLVIPFEYRLPDEKEIKKFILDSTAKGNNPQKNIFDDAVDALLKPIKDNADKDLLLQPRANGDTKTPTLSILIHHMLRFTRKNTSDYFIHKDLGGFLTSELEYYIKDQFLHIDDIDPDAAFVQLRKLRVFRAIAGELITFLADIENVQKRLWLKKKFVLGAHWCATLDRVPEELYATICASDEQREEWVRLYGIDSIKKNGDDPGYSKPLKPAFLKAHPFMMVDTRFFDEAFKRTLLASETMFVADAESGEKKGLDDSTDGLLVHSENFQALQLLQHSYKEKIKCIHIDPPYNTSTSGFLYKNDYRHSSWISFMENRISIAIPTLMDNSSFLCHIDENEYENLHKIFSLNSFLDGGTIVWDKRNPMNGGFGAATQHEYITNFLKTNIGPVYLRNDAIIEILEMAQKIKKMYSSNIINAQKKFYEWVTKNKKLTGGEKAYCNIDEQGRVFQSVSLRAPEPRKDKKFHEPLLHPITKKPCAIPPNGFSRTPETLKEMVNNGEIIFGSDETTQPRQKVFLTKDTHRQIPTILIDAKKGKGYTDGLGIKFPYCHPVSLYEKIVSAYAELSNDIVLDFFAGSGTTGHAVVSCNRYDKSTRKYILVEVGDHFFSTLKPRMKKVVFSEDWKKGKPTNTHTGISHAFKYFDLESYEDTLHNAIPDTSAGQDGDALHSVRYLLGMAEDGGLDLASFDHPFDYTIEVLTDEGAVTRSVDLVETFNYLYGIVVDKYTFPVNDKDGNREYVVVQGHHLDGKPVWVVWRDTAGFDKKATLQKEKDFLEVLKNDAPPGCELLVNGDTPARGFSSLDGLFKRLMFSGEE